MWIGRWIFPIGDSIVKKLQKNYRDTQKTTKNVRGYGSRLCVFIGSFQWLVLFGGWGLYCKKNIKKIIYKPVFFEMLYSGMVTPATPEYADKFSHFPP